MPDRPWLPALFVRRNISAGGKDYGVLRLSFSVAAIADGLWQLIRTALLLAVGSLLGGLLLPESPRYLVNKGDTRNAFKVLTLIRKDVDQTQVQIELDEIKAVAAQDTKGGVRELFRIARPALVAAIGTALNLSPGGTGSAARSG